MAETSVLRVSGLLALLDAIAAGPRTPRALGKVTTIIRRRGAHPDATFCARKLSEPDDRPTENASAFLVECRIKGAMAGALDDVWMLAR